MLFYMHLKARSSGGERYLDTVEVPGSKPGGPTIKNKWLQLKVTLMPFFCANFVLIVFPFKALSRISAAFIMCEDARGAYLRGMVKGSPVTAS